MGRKVHYPGTPRMAEAGHIRDGRARIGAATGIAAFCHLEDKPVPTTNFTTRSHTHPGYPEQPERLLPAGGNGFHSSGIHSNGAGPDWRQAAGMGERPSGGMVMDAGGVHCRVICADNRRALPDLAAGSVDLAITSPPYFSQREYATPGLGNEASIGEYLDNIMDTFAQVMRVMRPTGNIVYNMGDKIIDGSLQLIPYRFAARVMDEFGLRLVNDITWIKRNPTPHQFTRRLTVSTEPFFHFALGSRYRDLIDGSGALRGARDGCRATIAASGSISSNARDATPAASR